MDSRHGFFLKKFWTPRRKGGVEVGGCRPPAPRGGLYYFGFFFRRDVLKFFFTPKSRVPGPPSPLRGGRGHPRLGAGPPLPTVLKKIPDLIKEEPLFFEGAKALNFSV